MWTVISVGYFWWRKDWNSRIKLPSVDRLGSSKDLSLTYLLSLPSWSIDHWSGFSNHLRHGFFYSVVLMFYLSPTKLWTVIWIISQVIIHTRFASFGSQCTTNLLENSAWSKMDISRCYRADLNAGKDVQICVIDGAWNWRRVPTRCLTSGLLVSIVSLHYVL